MDRCRLCGGTISAAFRAEILGKHDVAYGRCTDCLSLQTEKPYWLDEAYIFPIARADTGIAFRNECARSVVLAVTRVLGIRKGPLLDVGGGTGLLCRMLRDRGCDAFLSDDHTPAIYAPDFVVAQDHFAPETLSLISAIEVFEHFAEPDVETARLFALKPRALVASTTLYSGEGSDWSYLSREAGQHVFFYSERALQGLAARHGYHYLRVGAFHVFFDRPFTRAEKLLLLRLLSARGLWMLGVWTALRTSGFYAS